MGAFTPLAMPCVVEDWRTDKLTNSPVLREFVSGTPNKILSHHLLANCTEVSGSSMLCINYFQIHRYQLN